MTQIKLSEWDDGNDPDVIIDTSGIPDVIQVNIHDLPLMTADPDKYCAILASGEQSTDSVSRMMVGSLLAAVCSEPAGVIDSGGIHTSYATRLIESLSQGRDTPLAPVGGLAAWSTLSEQGRKIVAKQVTGTMAEFAEAFPSPGDVNVITTGEPVVIDWGEDIIHARIPALMQTTAGIAGICGVPLGSTYGDIDAGVMTSGLSTIPGIAVSSIHVWNAETCARSKATKSGAVASARVMMNIARNAR